MIVQTKRALRLIWAILIIVGLVIAFSLVVPILIYGIFLAGMVFSIWLTLNEAESKRGKIFGVCFWVLFWTFLIWARFWE